MYQGKYHVVKIVPSEGYEALGWLSGIGWTSDAIQDMIDGVESRRDLISSTGQDAFVWGSEDARVFCDTSGVILLDIMSMRAGETITPVVLSHDVFLSFLRDFKAFVEKGYNPGE